MGMETGMGLTKTRTEPNRIEPVGGDVGGRIGPVRVVEGLQRGGPAEPEGAEGTEDDEGERVADEEFAQ